MQETAYFITAQNPVAENVLELVLSGEGLAGAPGQFVNVALPGLYLRRPFSICYCDEESLVIVYKQVGAGTQQLAQMRPGSKLSLLTNLGTGFDLTRAGAKPLLIGGGLGVAPLYYLACSLCEQGARPTVLLGFNRQEEIFYADRFTDLGSETVLMTQDGSAGSKGLVTDALSELSGHSFCYACGPLPMLKALHQATDLPGQYSLEARMGCGFGACLGCSIETKGGVKRICKEGPVLDKEELPW